MIKRQSSSSSRLSREPEDVAIKKLIAKEILSSLAAIGLEHPCPKSVRDTAARIEEGLHEVQMTHPEAAKALDISADTLTRWRKAGRIAGIPKNPHVSKKHYLYTAADVLRLRQCQPDLRTRR